jgi:predicted acetyltransferase
MSTIALLTPAKACLPAYVAALERGWSPNTLVPDAGRAELAKIATDPDGFLASLTDRKARGEPVTLPNGAVVPRLPSIRLWLWDGDFCGSLGMRWQPGTSALPDYCYGHAGYSIVPWKRQHGYATRALGLLLDEARREGLAELELTTDPLNVASQKVILANGGRFISRHIRPAEYGGETVLRFRVAL